MKSLQQILESAAADKIVSKKTGVEGAKEDIAYVLDHAYDVAGEHWFGDLYEVTLAVEMDVIFRHYGIKPENYGKAIPTGNFYKDFLDPNDNFKWIDHDLKRNEELRKRGKQYDSYFEQLYKGKVPKSRDLRKLFDPETSTWKVPLIRQLNLGYDERNKYFVEDIAFIAHNIDEIYDKYYRGSNLEKYQVYELEIGVGCWRYGISRREFAVGSKIDKDTYKILNDAGVNFRNWSEIQSNVYTNYSKAKSKRIKSFLEEAYISQSKSRVDLKTQYAGKIGASKTQATSGPIDIDNLNDKQLLKALDIPNYYSYLVHTKRGIEMERERACVTDAKGFMKQLRKYYKACGRPVKVEKFTPAMGWGDPDYPRGMDMYELDQEHYEGNCVRVYFKRGNETYDIESYVNPPYNY